MAAGPPGGGETRERAEGDAAAACPRPAAQQGAEASPSGREEHLRMLQEYRRAWSDDGSLLQRSARRVHKTLWWLMCFTGLDVLDYHERVLFSLGYIAVLALVLAGAGKQAAALLELWRDVTRRRAAAVNGGG
ncbi:hypothetical protein Rsub_12146 [Raphidocelis subcapitata]|uniref:Uncharacterized protein n=1 Tax=Raphidocelis subcapitata TaxID=307507 RepID=A0A2V0PI50_9CHLO|nr:hypothetical protein Rsub_12146 [Raphidocelis subcapitata]|eukprot:GBF99478.1 hypothetical protein Rsub_12146 [Raphidocelis subcapitata]